MQEIIVKETGELVLREYKEYDILNRQYLTRKLGLNEEPRYYVLRNQLTRSLLYMVSLSQQSLIQFVELSTLKISLRLRPEQQDEGTVLVSSHEGDLMTVAIPGSFFLGWDNQEPHSYALAYIKDGELIQMPICNIHATGMVCTGRNNSITNECNWVPEALENLVIAQPNRDLNATHLGSFVFDLDYYHIETIWRQTIPLSGHKFQAAYDAVHKEKEEK